MRGLLGLLAALLFCSACALPGGGAAPEGAGGAEALVHGVLEGLARRDPGPLARALDWDAICERAMAGLALDATARAEVRSSIEEEFPVAGRICACLGGGGAISLLHIRAANGTRCALVRAILDPGLEYWELSVDAAAGNPPRIVDIYDFRDAELLSEALRRSLRARQPDAGSEPSRDEASALLERLRAAERSGTGELRRAAVDLVRRFPDDPAHDLALGHAFQALGEHRAALARFDRLDATLGGDPYLDVHCGHIAFEARDLPVAKARYRRALSRDPSLQAAHWGLVLISLHERDFDATIGLLEGVERDFQLELADLEQVEHYREFVRSDAYRAWMERRRAAAR